MAFVPGANELQHRPLPLMLMLGKMLALAYCKPSVPAASKPLVSGTNQLPCFVYAMRNSFTMVALICQVWVSCTLYPSISPEKQLIGHGNGPYLFTPGLSF